MSDGIKTLTNGSVLEVTIDRPKANAIDLAASRRLNEVFCAFRDDPAARRHHHRRGRPLFQPRLGPEGRRHHGRSRILTGGRRLRWAQPPTQSQQAP